MSAMISLSTFISRVCQFIGGISLVIIVLVTIADVIKLIYDNIEI